MSEADRTFAQGMRYLNGINTGVDYPKALERFAYLASQGDARGINALAGMYRQGMGVAGDRAKARKLYAQASAMGFGKATYNLALMYKTAQGGEQDFKKAFELAESALQQGDNAALYLLGYLYYKGLGTKQDYAKAVEYFSKGTELGQVSSMYFLGLCYVGGFGVVQDIAKGKQLIQKAAEQGNDHAVEFIVKSTLAKYEKPANIDPQGNPYPAFISATDNPFLHLSGDWEGRMLQYDHGGQRVMEERSLKLQITDENGKLSGSWLQADTVAMELNAVRSESISASLNNHGAGLQAENMRYMRTWNRTYEIRSLRFSMRIDEKGDSLLYAVVEQFSPQTMEPGAPVMLELRKAPPSPPEGGDVAAASSSPPSEGLGEATFRVYPNPFLNELTVEFTVRQAGQYSIMMYDLAGRLVRNETVNVTAAGRSRIISKTIDTTDLQAATYAVTLKGKGVNVTTLVIKPVYY